MSQSSRHLLAGTGRRTINPPPNIAHGGWGAQKHEQAEGIDMDLWLTALALSDGVATALILDVDIQILTNDRADQIRSAAGAATGIPVSHIRAAATHTHSGPVPYKSWIEKGYEMVDPWFAEVARQAAVAAQEAVKNLGEVIVRAGRGECHINANRRCVAPSGERFLGVNREGPCDHGVQVVQLDSLAGEPVATLVNFACHPTIMGPPNRLITPDFPGAMKRVVESAVGGRCLFLQGAAGDQGPLVGFQGDPKVYRQFGAILGHSAAGVALGLRHLPASEQLREVIPSGAPLGIYAGSASTLRGLPLGVSNTEIMVPLKDGLPDREQATINLEKWKDALKSARARGDEAAITEAIFRARRADIQLRMADDFGGRTSIGVRAHVITFGDIAIVGCNIEPFCETGLAIKRDSPYPFTLFGGYTNGRLAYMATAGEWPKGGYEVDNSPFAQNAAAELQSGINARLRAQFHL